VKNKRKIKMNSISFSVKGFPKPWGSSEWEWRKRVSEEARKYKKEANEITDKNTFTVIVGFFIKGDKHMDLDNLAKPILDTLFKPRNAQVKDREIIPGTQYLIMQ